MENEIFERRLLNRVETLHRQSRHFKTDASVQFLVGDTPLGNLSKVRDDAERWPRQFVVMVDDL